MEAMARPTFHKNPPRFIRARHLVQAAFLLAWLGPFGLRLHYLCGPVFHCYACPLATFACPIGVLANFSTSAISGDGRAGNPFVTTQTKLRAPAGQVVLYEYKLDGLNGYLGGQAYRLADMNGTPGAGGLLRTRHSGTVVMFR